MTLKFADACGYTERDDVTSEASREHLRKHLPVVTLSAERVKRIKDTFDHIAGDGGILSLAQIKGDIFAYGTELQTLRLFKEYADTKAEFRSCGYSENQKSFYFRLTLNR